MHIERLDERRIERLHDDGRLGRDDLTRAGDHPVSWVKTATRIRATKNTARKATVARTAIGSGVSRISPVSDWNSRTILSGAASLRRVRERNDFMRGGPGVEMPMLFVPQPAADIATVEQLLMGTDIVDAAAPRHPSESRGCPSVRWVVVRFDWPAQMSDNPW
jgi:hypothetical protein